jgi:hypothetical protein
MQVVSGPGRACVKKESIRLVVWRGLIKEALAADGAAEAGNAIRSIHFALKLVVVREFFVCDGLATMLKNTSL